MSAKVRSHYGSVMTWTETHVFVDPMVDLRSETERASVLEAELAREIGQGHVLDEQPWRVVAEAAPQDEVLAAAGENAFLVHLTWTGRAERPPWPTAERVGSAEEFERLVEFRY